MQYAYTILCGWFEMRTDTLLFLPALMIILLSSCTSVPRNAPAGVQLSGAQRPDTRPTDSRLSENNLFSQSLGAAFSSERGFMGAYSIESTGLFWYLKNDFAGIYDQLQFTPRVRIPAELFTFSAELPATLTWNFPVRIQYTCGGTARASFRTRTDPMDTSTGWGFSAEGAAQANGMSKDPTQLSTASLVSSDNSLYRGSLGSQLTFYNDIVTPGIGFTSFFDLGTSAPTDNVFSWSLSHAFGSMERFIKLSGDSAFSSGESSTTLKLETGWNHWMLQAEASTTGIYSAGIGFKF